MGTGQLFIGLMSGTSMDAIDAVLVEFSGARPTVVVTHSLPLPAWVRTALTEIVQEGRCELEQLGRLDVTLGRLFAQAAQSLLRAAGVGPEQVRAIGSHGQTVYHSPDGRVPFTLQVGDPNTIAALTGITTVADFRRRDLAVGGQGAPLAPAFHAAVFRDPRRDRGILNIGGIANLTVLPADADEPVLGFDTGPGNGLLDSWAQRHLGTPMDADGAWAARGVADSKLLRQLLEDPYFRRSPPKSTGREYFTPAWLEERLRESNSPPMGAVDVQATLCELTARSVAAAVDRYAPEVHDLLVCGGGVHNATLMGRLRELLGSRTVDSTAHAGVDPDWVEAIAFAWLARQTLRGEPGNLPSVTGACDAVVLGGVYSGRPGTPSI